MTDWMLLETTQTYTSTEVKQRIRELEQRKIRQRKELELEIKKMAENLTPGNIVKNTLYELLPGDGLIKRLGPPALMLALGLAGNSFLAKKAGPVLGRLAGAVLGLGMSVLFSKKSGAPGKKLIGELGQGK
jgi:hypothetical protein